MSLYYGYFPLNMKIFWNNNCASILWTSCAEQKPIVSLNHHILLIFLQFHYYYWSVDFLKFIYLVFGFLRYLNQWINVFQLFLEIFSHCCFKNVCITFYLFFFWDLSETCEISLSPLGLLLFSEFSTILSFYISFRIISSDLHCSSEYIKHT